MIDPARPFKHESGFGHYDKFYWTLDKEKYPNFPFEILGVILKPSKLELLFRIAIGAKIGQFSWENELEQINEVLDTESRKDLIFSWPLSKKDNQYIYPHIRWSSSSKYCGSRENLQKMKEKYPKNVFIFDKPIIINGLENVKIKWKGEEYDIKRVS